MSNENQKTSNSIYTNSYTNSYDRKFSAMSYLFANNAGMVQLAPIYDKFIDKEPKSGDKVYDYEKKVNFSVDAQDAITILNMINVLMESVDGNEPFPHVTYHHGNDDYSKEIKIFAPNINKLGGKIYENYVIKFTKTVKKEKTTMYHIMNNKAYTIGKEDEVVVKVICCYLLHSLMK